MKLPTLGTLRNEKGLVMIEYALIAAMVALACYAVLPFLSAQVTAKFNQIITALQ